MKNILVSSIFVFFLLFTYSYYMSNESSILSENNQKDSYFDNSLDFSPLSPSQMNSFCKELNF